MTEKPVWYFGVDCVGCHRRITSQLVDPSHGDRIITFSGPGKIQMTCPLCGRVALYATSAFTSQPADAPKGS